jgi:hypothetical protein
MKKINQALRVLFSKEEVKAEDKPVEVPNIAQSLMDNPELLRYIDNEWVERVNDKDGEPFLIDGKRVYQIIDVENGLKQSRIIELNRLMEQSKDYGMTSENVEYNLKLMSSINQGIVDARGNADEVLALSNQLRNILDGFKLAKETKLGDDLIFGISALVFVFQDENPSDFNVKEYQQKVKAFRNNDLSFFFYTHSFKVLSGSLKIFMKDTKSFMKEVLTHSLTTLKRNQLVLAEFLSTNSIGINETELEIFSVQAETLNLRIKCLESMALNFTTGYLPLEELKN